MEFSKIDVTTGKELPGAHLEIRDKDNNLVDAWVSTDETHFFELLPGMYTLTETISPEGYELSTESIEFEVKEDGSTTKVDSFPAQTNCGNICAEVKPAIAIRSPV